MVAVPGSIEELVSKSEDKNVLHHLLTQVVIDTEDLLFLPVGLEGLLEVARALQVLTEGLLNLEWGINMRRRAMTKRDSQ